MVWQLMVSGFDRIYDIEGLTAAVEQDWELRKPKQVY